MLRILGLFIVISTISFSSFAASDGQESPEATPKWISYYLKQTFQISGFQIDMPRKEIDQQDLQFNSKVPFVDALTKATSCFLTSFPKKSYETPLEVAYYSLNIDDIEAAYKFLVSKIEKPTTSLMISKIHDEDLKPAGDESLSSSWIFSLSIESLSDHIYWAVVDRETGSTYCYGYN